MADVSTKKEICTISFRFFGTMLKEACAKPLLVSGLEGLIAAQPAVLSAAAAAPAAPAPTGAAQGAAEEGHADSGSEFDPGDESD